MKNSEKQQRDDILLIIKHLALTLLFGIIMIAGFGCVIYAAVMQNILLIKKYGAIIDIVSFIPHKTAWFFIGIIPCILSVVPFIVHLSETYRLKKVYKSRKKHGWYDKNAEENK